MHIRDLSRLSAAQELSCDVCIVGSGPAGLTIATELASTGKTIIVVESGPRSGEDETSSSLNRTECVGAIRQIDQKKVRNRTLGGSSMTWSGRCTAFDALDYGIRPWVEDSGWPISEAAMRPFVRRAYRYLGLVAVNEDGWHEGLVAIPGEAVGENEIRPVFWQFSRDRSSIAEDYVRFGPRFCRLDAAGVRVLTRATVTEVETNQNGKTVKSLELMDAAGVRRRLKARYVVLCCGGIENARILLASNRIQPQGVGNRHDLVGRYFMDHPRAIVGTFDFAARGPVQQRYGLKDYKCNVRMQQGWSLTVEAQRNHRLLNCAAWATQHLAEDDVWRALRGLGRPYGRSRKNSGAIALRHADQVVTGVWNKFVRGKPLPRRWSHLDLEVTVEQEPNRASRITLSNIKDAHGIPISRIDWKVGNLEKQTAIYLAHAVNKSLADKGEPTAQLVDWVRERRIDHASFCDPAHPMGSTRMASNESAGVVDLDGRVFDVDNLYLAGSSVFPTGSHANPTLMIVALALRVADHLRLRLAKPQPVYAVTQANTSLLKPVCLSA